VCYDIAMESRDLVGAALVAGLIVFLVGAAAWRLAYEKPPHEALRVIHDDRRRRAWIHLWMLPAMFITTAGLFGLVPVLDDDAAAAPAAMAAAVFALGAICWIAALAFRLTVVPWAAEHTVTHGDPPDGFAALDSWAGALYAAHMASAYAAFAILGVGLLAGNTTPGWVGAFGIGLGLTLLVGIVATRFAGPFNPPILAHSYTALVGVMLLAA
jgi:hypothetical protein